MFCSARLCGYCCDTARLGAFAPEGISMRLQLHANATTTPRTRALIQASSVSVAQLARDLGVCETTVRRWRARSSQQDRPHARHNLGQSTTPEDEALIGELRGRLGLSLDDICEVMRRCVNPGLSRSAIYRALRRLGLSQPTTAPAPVKSHPFEDTCFGFVHIDLKYLGKLKGRGEYACLTSAPMGPNCVI